MRAAPGIHHRRAWIVAHAAGTQVVRRPARAILRLPDLNRAGRLQDLVEAPADGLQHLLVVGPRLVDDARRRQTVQVLDLGIEADRVAQIGQLIAHRGQADHVAEQLLDALLVVRAPTGRALRHAERPLPAVVDLHREAARKAVGRIGFVEVLNHAAGRNAAPGVQPLLEAGVGENGQVLGEVLAHQAAGVRQAVGKGRRLAQQQQPRGFHGVARHDDGARRDLLFLPIGVEVDDAARLARRVHGDLPRHALRPNVHAAGRLGLAHIGHINAAFGGNFTAQATRPALNGGRPAVPGLAGQRRR